MQKLYIVFISSVLIVSNNFGMDSDAAIKNTGKSLSSPTIFELAEIFSERSKTNLSQKTPRKIFGNICNGRAGNITNNIERRFNQSPVISEWALSLSSDSNSNNVSTKKLYQKPIKTNNFSLLFENNGGEPVINIDTDSYVYVIFKQMLDSGNFDPNIVDSNGDPLLHRLIKRTKDYTKIKDFLASRVSVNAVDKEGKTALSHAVELNDQKMIDMLLRYGAVVHVNMLREQSLLLGKIFCLQQCFSCNIHPENMSNIPCINQHIGMFICKDCYNKSNAKCPLCRRSLDEYGK